MKKDMIKKNDKKMKILEIDENFEKHEKPKEIFIFLSFFYHFFIILNKNEWFFQYFLWFSKIS